MLLQPFETNREPRSELAAAAPEMRFERFEIDPFPVLDFIGIWVRAAIKIADHDVIAFMFHVAIAHPGPINELEDSFQFTMDSHFLEQSSPAGLFDSLSGAWVAAARIRPQPAGMVFSNGPFLEKGLSR